MDALFFLAYTALVLTGCTLAVWTAAVLARAENRDYYGKRKG
ncbi:MAG: hypothetical protein JG766_2662 [Desulfacinum sp.]|jgi:hypothetical protein|nr:hypothetical protein [Desulfacinum sp.]